MNTGIQEHLKIAFTSTKIKPFPDKYYQFYARKPFYCYIKRRTTIFYGDKIPEAEGIAKEIDFESLRGKKIIAFESWRKHFLTAYPISPSGSICCFLAPV